jgi:hypothetical protein
LSLGVNAPSRHIKVRRQGGISTTLLLFCLNYLLFSVRGPEACGRRVTGF